MRVTSLAEFARVIAALRSLEEDSQTVIVNQTVIVSSGSVAPAEVNLGSQKCESQDEAPAPPKDEVAKKRESKKAKAQVLTKSTEIPAEPASSSLPEQPPVQGSGEADDIDADEEEDDDEPAVETPAAPTTKPKAKFTPKMTDPDARFSDIVVELHKQGFHDPKDIAVLCEKVHEKVPAVKKVKVEELAKRVERVFEIEGLG